MVRTAQFAGTLYDVNFDILDKQIRKAFLEEPGPGSTPKTRDHTSVVQGIIVPCDRLDYTGYAMAWAYKELAEHELQNPIIILGTNYTGGSTCLSVQDWETPFGLVHTDTQLAEQLHNETGILINEKEHIANFSIELQLPFVQYAFRDKLNSVQILPLLIGKEISMEQITVLIKSLQHILHGKTPTFICSSNLVHFGEQYKYTPFVYNIKESIENIDYHCIDLIKKYDATEIIQFVEQERTTIYGYKTLAFFLTAMNILYQSPDIKLQEYYSSSLFEKEHKDVVSYISMTTSSLKKE